MDDIFILLGTFQREQCNIQGHKIEMSNNLDGHNSFYISASDNSKAVLKIFNLKNEWDIRLCNVNKGG